MVQPGWSNSCTQSAPSITNAMYIFFFLRVGVIHQMEVLYVRTASENHFYVLEKKQFEKGKFFERDNKKGIRVKNDSFQLSVKTRLNQETLEQVHCEKENRKSLYTKDKRK